MREIAQAFLVSESAMEQRITRAKRKVAAAGVAFETPSAAERVERIATVAAMVYLLFNEGYSASGGEAHIREPLCEEAIRLARLLLEILQDELKIPIVRAEETVEAAPADPEVANHLEVPVAVVLVQHPCPVHPLTGSSTSPSASVPAPAGPGPAQTGLPRDTRRPGSRPPSGGSPAPGAARPGGCVAARGSRPGCCSAS